MEPDALSGDDLLGLEDGAAAPRAAPLPRRGLDRLGVDRLRGSRVAELFLFQSMLLIGVYLLLLGII